MNEKRVMAVVTVLCMIVSLMTVYASEAEPQSIRTTASISITGSNVTCTGIVLGNAKDPISAEMKLWRDNTCIAIWSAKGTGNLNIVKTKSVTKGHTYKFTVDANVAGLNQQRVTSSSFDY